MSAEGPSRQQVSSACMWPVSQVMWGQARPPKQNLGKHARGSKYLPGEDVCCSNPSRVTPFGPRGAVAHAFVALADRHPCGESANRRARWVSMSFDHARAGNRSFNRQYARLLCCLYCKNVEGGRREGGWGSCWKCRKGGGGSLSCRSAS